MSKDRTKVYLGTMEILHFRSNCELFKNLLAKWTLKASKLNIANSINMYINTKFSFGGGEWRGILFKTSKLVTVCKENE